MAFEPIEWKENEPPALDAENLNRIEEGIANALPKSGGTMTGSLTLHGEPTEDNEAANKGYVDNNIILISYSVNFDSLQKNVKTFVFNIPNFDSLKYIPVSCGGHDCDFEIISNYGIWYDLECTGGHNDTHYDLAAEIQIDDNGDVYIRRTYDYIHGRSGYSLMLIPAQRILLQTN